MKINYCESVTYNIKTNCIMYNKNNEYFKNSIYFQVAIAMALLTSAKFGLTDSEMIDLLTHKEAFHSSDTYGKSVFVIRTLW